MKEIHEFHQQGRLSIDNVDMIEEMDLSNADLGLQVAKDGRVWLCVNGIALIRFTPQHKDDEVTRLLVVGNPERGTSMIQMLLDSKKELDDLGICIVERPELNVPDMEFILEAHPIELPEVQRWFNEKTPRRGGQKRNQWKNVKKLK